jgi:hypothetical protein
MTTKTFKAKIKLKSGIQEVTVQADSYFKAKEMLEAQYADCRRPKTWCSVWRRTSPFRVG